MAAKWSDIWAIQGVTRRWRKNSVDAARFTKPSTPAKKTGGKYPHLQPFFRNKVASS